MQSLNPCLRRPAPLPIPVAMAAVIALAMAAAAAAAPTAASPAPRQPDRVIIETRADEQIALKDVATGRLDLVYGNFDPSLVRSLPPAERDRLRIVDCENLRLSLVFNAAPDSAPWLCPGSDGKLRFNPFGIREARQALNRLLDREALARKLGGGSAAPLILPFSPGSPGAAPWYRAAFGAGFSQEGDRKAAAAFAAALEKAASRPELAGRLASAGGRWRFNGDELEVRLLTRADRPNDSLLVGLWLKPILEGLGLRVEILDRGRAECVKLLRSSPPADLAWSIYTEAWGSGEQSAWQEALMDQLYDAEGLHWLPPGSPEGPWKPSTPLFRAAMDRIWAGGYADRAAYERDVAAATRAALDDSFRLFLVAMDRSAVLNAARFPRLPLTDRAAGIQSPWFWHSLEVAPEGEGRPLRAAVVSRAATVFQATWEPMVGWDLRMPISNPVVDAIVDHDVGIVDPATGKPAWFSQRLVEAKAAPPSAARSAGSAAPAGIAVPATALVWDGLRHAWKAAGSGMAAKARVVFDYGEGRWHDGRAGGAADALHFLAFVADWSVEDGPGDRRFDEAVRTGWARLLDKLVAVEPLSAARLAVYADWDWGADPERLASLAYRPTGMLPWTIAEALAAIVAESPEEGRRRAFVGDEQRASVDVLDPDCVKLIRERLLAFRAAGALPPQLAGLVSREEASAAWTAAIDFIDRHGHAFISNGPYLLDRVHFDPPAFELARNPGYPSGASEFRGARARFLARVEGLELPALAKSAGDLELGLAVSAIAYPEGSSKPAGAEARVGVALLSGAGELAKEAFPSGEGRFSVRFSPSELARLGTGVVKVIAEAAIGEGLPDFGTAELLLLP